MKPNNDIARFVVGCVFVGGLLWAMQGCFGLIAADTKARKGESERTERQTVPELLKRESQGIDSRLSNVESLHSVAMGGVIAFGAAVLLLLSYRSKQSCGTGQTVAKSAEKTGPPSPPRPAVEKARRIPPTTDGDYKPLG